MSIKLNTNQSNITVYDEIGYKHATNKEVVPLLSVIKGDFKTVLVNMFSDSIGLSESERELYNVLVTIDVPRYSPKDKDSIEFRVNDVTGIAVIINGKSNITYRRAVDRLIKLGVIKYVNSYNVISLNKEYDIRSIEDAAKYIVIEVNK